MIEPLTPLQEIQFDTTKRYIIEQAKPEADMVRNKYIDTEAPLLAVNNGITIDDARFIVASRVNQDLLDGDYLIFDDGSTASVRDVLEDPGKYDGISLHDPLEPEAGKCKAKFYANSDTGKAIIHSQLHGGINYFLKLSPTDTTSQPYEWTFDEAYELVVELGELDQQNLEIRKCTKDIIISICENRSFDRTESDDLRDHIKKKLGFKKGTLDAIASDAVNVGGFISYKSLPKQSHVAAALSTTMKESWFFSVERGRWYHYNGKGLWESKESEKWESFTKSAVEQHEDIKTIGYSSSYLKGIHDLLAVDLTAEHANVPGHIIPFKNGILNSTNGKIFNHEAKYHFTWQLEFDYDTSASCAFFLAWLKDRLGTARREQLVRAIICAILQGRVDLQFFVELYGSAGAGKSVLQWLFEKLVGRTYIGSTDIKSLETNRFEAAGLVDKKLIMITDSSGFTGEVSILKAITGNDLIRIEQKNMKTTGEGCRFSGIVVVASNQPIKFNDHSNAISRRRVPIHFAKPIDNNEYRDDIHGDLERELPGIVNWALQMPTCEMETVIKQNKGDGQSEDAKAILLETNIMASWLHDNTVYAPGECVNIGHGRSSEMSQAKSNALWLYPNYLQYLVQEGEFSKPLAVNKFGNTLNTLLTETLKLKQCFKLPKTSKGSQFQGIALREGSLDDRKSPIDVA